MNLDLGGVGKGYAVGCIGRMLRDLEVTSALIDAGTSSALALGAPPGQAGWRVALADPRAVGAGDPEPEPHAFLGEVLLRDTALSVSGVRGGDRGGWAHVLDPRTGAPTQGVWQAVVVDPSPVVAEVLSTALLVAGERLLERLGERFPSAAALLLAGPEGRVLKTANWPGP
jgi:thiamine biosynthesis lipoprotein